MAPNAHYKVAIKTLDYQKALPKPNEMIYALGKLKIHLVHHTAITNGYIAITDTASDMERIFSKQATAALKNINLTPITPDSLLAAKTLVLRQVAEGTGKQTEDSILKQIRVNHKGAAKVIKLPNKTRMFKVVFDTVTSAQAAKEKGMIIDHLRIPPAHIENEIHVRITTCMKCYAHDDHLTRNCTATLTVCSNCAVTGHRYTQCPTSPDRYRCINCLIKGVDAKHHTLSMRCPTRKGTIKAKKDKTVKHDG